MSSQYNTLMLKKLNSILVAILSLVLAVVATSASYLHVTVTLCAHIACTYGPSFTDRGWPAPITTNDGFNPGSTAFDLLFWLLVFLVVIGLMRSIAIGTFGDWLKRTVPILIFGLLTGFILAAASLLITAQNYTDFSVSNQTYAATITQFGWPLPAYQTVEGAPASQLDRPDQPGLDVQGGLIDVVFWIIVSELILVPLAELRHRRRRKAA